MTTAGLVLGAGGGSRFGGPKALALLHGVPLAQRAVTLLREGGCEPVHLVLGAKADEVARQADLGGATIVHNPQWPTGIGSSLRAGLASLPSTVAAVVIVLVDQPLIGPEAVRRVIAAHAAGAAVAVATYGGQFGHPVLLSRPTWAEAGRLAKGDLGARPYLRAHPEQVVRVSCDGTGAPDDVDTPADLTAIAARAGTSPTA